MSHEPIPLPSRAYEVLLRLVERSGELVEKNNLSQCILTLRKALGETAGERRFILTVPGRGFKFVAPVRVMPHVYHGQGSSGAVHPALAPPTLELVPPPAVVPSLERLAGRSRHRVAVAAALVLAGGLGLAAWLITAPTHTAAPSCCTSMITICRSKPCGADTVTIQRPETSLAIGPDPSVYAFENRELRRSAGHSAQARPDSSLSSVASSRNDGAEPTAIPEIS